MDSSKSTDNETYSKPSSSKKYVQVARSGTKGMDILDISSLVSKKKLEVKFQFDTGFGGYQPRILGNDSTETAVTAFQ